MLMQVMIAGAVGAVIALGMSTLINNVAKGQYRLNVSQSRGAIVDSVRYNAQSTLSLFQSALYAESNGDPMLMNCICGRSACSSVTNRNLVLVDAKSTPIANGATAIPYGAQAEPCGGSACVLQAATQFSCIGSNCGSPNMDAFNPVIRVDFTVGLTSAGKANRSIGYLKDVNGPPVDVPAQALLEQAVVNGSCILVRSISPTHGPQAGGTSVTLTGVGLDKANSIKIGGITCTISSQTSTSLVCVTGASSAGLKDVIASKGTSPLATLSQAYRYDATGGGGGGGGGNGSSGSPTTPTLSCNWGPGQFNLSCEYPGPVETYPGACSVAINGQEYRSMVVRNLPCGPQIDCSVSNPPNCCVTCSDGLPRWQWGTSICTCR